MGYAYMELRCYSEAIDCLNESIEIAEEKVSDLYFRRAQAVFCNRLSSKEDLKSALEDVRKAIQILKSKKNLNDKLYEELEGKIIKNIENKNNEEISKISSKI